jgi:adenylate cyclase
MERKLTAILSADVKGYSRLMGEDEEATIHTLTAYRAVMTALIQQRRGRVVDSPGDNLLAEFASVVDAMRCAVEVQQELKAKNAALPDHRRMEFRIGINLGDVVVEGERIYGEGVNIAARLEGLAEPGGICISGTVHDHVENKLALRYEYVGEQAVKNIAKPVRVWRVEMEPEDVAAASNPVLRQAQHERQSTPVTLSLSKGAQQRRKTMLLVAGLLLIAGTIITVRYLSRPPLSIQPSTLVTQEAPPLPLPDKPSIVVLPFVNMSEDPQQDYFSDGITEDLTTALSQIASLFVIARNSAFTYKGKAVKVQDVGRELGVQYILEGSVRKANNRVRITAQLVDAPTDAHLWAERYDRPLKDIFALQDEIVQKIVTTLKLQLTLWGQGILVRKTTDNLEAYDSYLRGVEYFYRLTKEANLQARQMFEKAVELDPQYAEAYARLSWTHSREWIYQWVQDPQTLEQAFALAQKAVTLDDSLPLAHRVLGVVYLWKKQHEQAIAEAERAIVLDPNNAEGYVRMAHILKFVGRSEEAIQLMEKAMRLNPHYPFDYLFELGASYHLTGRYEEALVPLKKVLTLNPNFVFAHVNLAICYAELGRLEEARAEMAEAQQLNPTYSLEWVRQNFPYKDPAELERYLVGLRKAGLK